MFGAGPKHCGRMREAALLSDVVGDSPGCGVNLQLLLNLNLNLNLPRSGLSA